MPLNQLPLPLHDLTAMRLKAKLRRLRYGDALVCRRWRVEYHARGHGRAHYRMYHNGHLVGRLPVREEMIEVIDGALACYLAGLGWSPAKCRVVIGGAWSALDGEQYKVAPLPIARVLDFANRKATYKWLYDVHS